MSQFTKAWIIEKGIPIANSYNGNLTLRALHYRLVSIGMTNDLNHYKKVVSAMIDARWDNLISFSAFLDYERETIGATWATPTNPKEKANTALSQIKMWADDYRKNRWENQPIYPEVFIEKKALIGCFEGPCREWDVALNPCKGYPSLTFLYDAARRFMRAASRGQECVLLYFGDYDPSGEDIPRSIQVNLNKLGADVEIKRIALMEKQVVKWKLPPAPTKASDTRSAMWDGLGQVELDAVEPSKLSDLCYDAIQGVFNQHNYDLLMDMEVSEKKKFKAILKKNIKDSL